MKKSTGGGTSATSFGVTGTKTTAAVRTGSATKIKSTVGQARVPSATRKGIKVSAGPPKK